MSKSLPVETKPLPPNAVANIEQALGLFNRYDREGAEAAGIAVGPPRPGMIKAWGDESDATKDPAGKTSYWIFDDQLGREVLVTLPNTIARTFNLPGKASYPAYVVPSTPATEGLGYPVNPESLSTQEQADALAVELGDGWPASTWKVIDTTTGGKWGFQANGETRRQWGVSKSGQAQDSHYVGVLLAAKNANGIGAPGHWDLSAPEPKWAADSTGEPGPDVMPLPLRVLIGNERFMLNPSPMNGDKYVVTTLPLEAEAPVIGGGGFTTADRATLNRIEALIRAKGGA